MTPRVTLLTGAEMPVPDGETALLAATLDRSGMDARIVAWSDEAAIADPGDLVVIRSTWDYTVRPDTFLATLARWQAPLWNPRPVIEANLRKRYLVELADAGVPVVPTRLLTAGDTLGTVTTPDGRIVLKPEIAAGSDGIGLFDVDDPRAAVHLESLFARGDVLLQPYLPSVQDGERSLMYLGGSLSHAVRKVPADGDFRVQSEYGGVTTRYIPSAAERRVAEAALAEVGADLLYARGDLVPTAGGPLLMELELIEPDLFLTYADGAMERFAEVIASAIPR
jgi:glutathione synthase/RimK-type ligase-like ATP-grasp enzyme